MAENYYAHPNRNLPDIVQCHVDTLVVYIASLLFPQEFKVDPQKAYNRILISDVNAGTNVSLGDAIEFMRSMNNNFPFVAYNVGDPMPSSWGNMAPVALTEQLYVEELNAYIRCFPMELELDFVAFYVDSLDQRRCHTILGGEDSTATRLYTPALFDDIEVKLPIDLQFEFSKGSLAGEFEQNFMGRLWDVIFKITIRYYEYIIDEIPLPGTQNVKDMAGIYPKQINVAPVENIIFRLFSQFGAKTSDSILINETVVPDTLKVVSTTPVNNASNVSRNVLIQIEMNKPVVPDTVTSDSIKIIPSIERNVYFNTSYTKINIENTAISGFQLDTVYTVEVSDQVRDADNTSLEIPFVFSFKTQKTY